jgi:hypothetical protein
MVSNRMVTQPELNKQNSLCAASILAISMTTAPGSKATSGIFAYPVSGSALFAGIPAFVNPVSSVLPMLSVIAVPVAPTVPAELLPDYPGDRSGTSVMDAKRRDNGKPANELVGVTGAEGTDATADTENDSNGIGKWQKQHINSRKLVSRPGTGRVWSVRGATIT